MLFSHSHSRIWLCTTPTDMRCSFNGLSARVQHHLQHNPLSGDCFVFINRSRSQMKVLYFEPGGYCIWGKRLEQGRFAPWGTTQACESLSPARLKCLIEGLDIHVIKQRVRYQRD
jgi:transposase